MPALLGGAALAASSAAISVAYAQPAANAPPSEDAPPSAFDAYAPRVKAVRLTGPAPAIDGFVDDAVWAEADVISDFYQVEPMIAAPSQETRAYILYDERTLYIGLYMYDDEPDRIRRSLMERDPPIQDDDAVRILIDPFGTFRDAFFFAVNPNGARNDALIENSDNFRDEWDTIWRAKARVVEDGWTAEFAIPFQSIAFDPNLEEWNLQIVRTIRRDNEEIRWSNVNRARGRIDMTNPGRLAGVEDVSSGLGLEGQLFVTGSAARDHELQDTDLELEPSANFFYKITPSLTGSLTFNTDFSDAPLDSRQVNTGRFSLFFPETRDFFLQDAASFEFGGGLFSSETNGLPFFSRRIGIVDGAPVDVTAAAKISGKAGPFNIGAISARTGARDDLDGQTLSTVRVAANVLSESKVGLIATHGDPTGETDNTVAGADFQYRNSTLIGNGQLNADFVFLRSFTDGEEGSYFGTRINYDGDYWDFNARALQIDEDYAPRLGFANRTGIRRYRGWTRKTWRPSGSIIRQFSARANAEVITDLDDEQLDRFLGGVFEVETNAGDEAGFEIENGFLDIREPFDLAGEVPIPVGEYRFNEYEVYAEMTEARPFSLAAGVEWGGAFDGDFVSVSSGVTLRPNRFFRLEGEYEFTKFDLPLGEIGIHIATIENTIAFTPDMTLKTEIQYDNVSESLSVFSRFRWEPRPEREIFLSLAHGALIEREDFPRSYRSQATGFSVRLGHTFRL